MDYKRISAEEDRWTFLIDDSTGKHLYFNFHFMPNDWFKSAHKTFINDSLKINNLSLATLYRYNYTMRHFYDFLKEKNINIEKFEDLRHIDIQVFINYLMQSGFAKSTQSTIISALKRIIEHGRTFEYEGYPSIEIFDGNEYKRIGPEDSLKTKYINDDILKKIESALKIEKNLFIKSLIEISMDTGARVGDILELKKDSLTEDFTGKPILRIVSSKNNLERFIPVSRRVYRAVRSIIDHTEKLREIENTEYIFIYRNRNNEIRRIYQKYARNMLSSFLKRHNIINSLKGEKITFHSFRHTLGTDMLNNGMTIFEIQDYLGHESTHSTALYAKVKSPIVQSQYKKVGFIGLIQKDKKEIIKSKAHSIDPKDIKSAALPDGYCGKPIDNQGNLCAKFNACIICPKFITTPEHLPIHKNHLERLRLDREEYMKTEYIGTQEHLEKIEYALETIIGRLEEMQNGSQEAGRL